jgi:hypothetical protein
MRMPKTNLHNLGPNKRRKKSRNWKKKRKNCNLQEQSKEGAILLNLKTRR